MNVLHYIKLLLKYVAWLILVPVICAATVFFLTKHTKKQYVSYTTLYTGVASGYSITSTEDEKLDYFAVNNAFDNLLSSAKSRETIEQVSLHLLSEHLALNTPNPEKLGPVGFEALRVAAGNDLWEKAHQLKTPEKIYNYISSVYASKVNNVIVHILEQKGSFYNIDELKSNLVVARISTSDMLQVTYTCTDPAVCQRTLEIHSSIFTANYQRLKSDQTYSAVQYFEAKLAESKAKLQKSEDDLKVFGQQNRIINYYEQTRYVAQSKEELNKQIYAEKVAQSGSDKALNLMQSKLNSREKQVTNSLNVIDLREKLSAANAALERAKIYSNKDRITELTAKAKALDDSIKNEADRYMNLNYSLETIPRSALVQEWVDNAVASDKAKAGITVLNNQNQNYLRQFDELAPLGSTLKRLERQIDINEKEFLAILHGLNLARLRQSNIALNSNIAVQDKPFFPLQAQPSTRALLIIVSFIVGFVLVVATIIIRELMDSSVRTPERAKDIIMLPLGGISALNTGAKPLGYQITLRNLLTEQFINIIHPYIAADIETNGRAQISLITTKADVYKSHDIELLHNCFALLYKKPCWIIPQGYADEFAAGLPGTSYKVYTPNIAQLNHKQTGELVDEDLSAHNLLIYVSPNLSQNNLPLAIAKLSCVNILAFNARHTWNTADKDILSKTKEVMPSTPFFTWLVNTDETNLDGVIGEVPKQRSWLRKKIKKLVTLNLL